MLLDNFQEPGAFFEAVLGAMGDAVFVVRPSDRRIMMCNGSAERLFERTQDELVGSTTELLYPTEADFRLLAEVSEAELRKGHAYQGVFTFSRSGGEIFEAEVTISAIRPDDWEAGVVSVLRDISRERRVEAERARMAERRIALERLASLGELAGGVAHDINNLLLPIMVNVELALPDADDHLAGLLEEVKEAALRGRGLTRKLLAFARQQPAERSAMELGDFLRATEPVLRAITGRRSTLELSVGDEPVMVEADPALLEQMLVALVSNARDATEDGGRIVVSVTTRDVEDAGDYGRTGATGHFAYLEVEDDGTGIPQEIRHRIFEPFFTTKEEKRSTGLGLSSALGIVEQHDGHIEIQNRAGGGTRVSVGLPLARSGNRSDDLGGSPQPPSTDAGSGRTVLVVEDDDAVRRVTARALKSFGYAVQEAADGPAALHAAETMDPTPDVVVTDVVMPAMSGLELRDRLRHELPEVPVVFVSGYSWSALEEEGIDPGSVAILPKPFSPTQLAEAVASAIARGSQIS